MGADDLSACTGWLGLTPACLVALLDLFGFAPMDVYLLIVNLVTFALLIIDKLRAEQRRVDKWIPGGSQP